MIISHKHKFIFFKTRKTAGSSIQVSLAKHCGSEDIITGQYRDGVDDHSHSAGLNMDKFWTNHPHPPIFETKKFLGEEIWNSYFKFAFIRNPYEIQISRYFWEKKGKGNTVDECSVDGFREWVTDGNMLNHDLLYPYIMIDDKIELDYIGRYETLQWDFDFISGILKLPKSDLPVKKGGYRDKLHYSEYYDDELIDLVGNFHAKDIITFGYNFNPEFSVSRMGPVVTKNMLKDDLGDNINGASLIEVPEWIENPLGKYYLYFAHHSGKSIRMAYSDNIEHGWKIYHPGTLKLENSNCIDHIASPDVHIDNVNKRILMYYHGVTDLDDAPHNQCSFLAFSKNALDFTSKSGILGMFYFRVFNYKDKYYALAKNKNIDGVLYQSDRFDGDFQPVFNLIPNMRHASVYIDSDFLYIFYTVVGDSPESIMVLKIKLDRDIENWEIIENQILLKPELEFEGHKLQMEPSLFGSALWPKNELRDPFVFKNNGELYMFYSFAGEVGIALSKIKKMR